jgi:hypothetical protein
MVSCRDRLGLVGAFFQARFLRRLLFGISASDGPTTPVIVVTMTAVVVAATYSASDASFPHRSNACVASGGVDRLGRKGIADV